MHSSGDGFREGIVALLPRLRRFARSLSGHASDADDLVQAVVERALLSGHQWQPESRLDSWLFRIMRNAWIDETRSRNRRARIFAPEEAGSDVGVSVTDAQIQGMSVQAAMARLPDEQRVAVALVLVEGLSYKESAAILDIPMGTLTSRLARGREALQRMLSDDDGQR